LDKRIKRIELARFSDYFPLDVFHPIKALLLAKDLKAVIEKENRCYTCKYASRSKSNWVIEIAWNDI